MKQIITILVFTVCCKFLFAQNPVARNINAENGLPSNTVYNMLQDDDGYIWLGHDKGLSRYDGTNFTNYSTTAQQGKSVSNLMLYNNVIWCQDFSGNFYYTKGNHLEKENRIKNHSFFTPANILQNKILTLINNDSILTFDLETKEYKSIFYKNTLSTATYFNKNEVLLSSNKNIYSYNGITLNQIQNSTISTNQFSYFLKTKQGIFAIVRDKTNYLYKLNNKTIDKISFLTGNEMINDISFINNEIWFSTTNGAFCFDENLNSKYNFHSFFTGNNISKVLLDKENNYWFSTINKGVFIVNNINNQIFKYGNESIAALSFYKNNEILAATSSNQIFTFNKNTNAFNTIIINAIKGEVIHLNYDSITESIISGSSSLLMYKNGKKELEKTISSKGYVSISNDIFVCPFTNGIGVYAKNENIKITNSWIQKWVTTESGINYLVKGYRGRSVYFNPTDTTIYTSTAKGLHYFNPSYNSEIKLNNNSIYASCLTMLNGVLYAGTFTDGLIKITNKSATALSKLNTKLPKSIYKIFAQKNESLWMITDEGILQWNTITNEILNYNTADGIPKAEIKDLLIDKDKLYIATTEGLVVLNLINSPINKTAPKILLQKLIINNNELEYKDNLVFDANENNIQLFLSLISFKDNKKCEIKYRINNGEWNYLLNGSRILQLASLASGKYTIEIIGNNEDGIESVNKLIIKFKIKAPFYKTFWFWVLVLSLLFFSIYAYFTLKLRSEKNDKNLVQQKMELERELHQSMLASIKSQMNPHFLFNALNTIQSYIYTNEKENASLYLGKFSELTRMILDMSNKESVSLTDEIKAVELYLELEKLRFENKLIYSIIIQSSLDTDSILIPTMLVQPYVENAIKHGLMHLKKQWNLVISFNKNANGIEVIIEDNGVGRKASEAINAQRYKQHQSFATNANQKRLEILNKNFSTTIIVNIIDKYDEHKNAIGTKVILQIPTLH